MSNYNGMISFVSLVRQARMLQGIMETSEKSSEVDKTAFYGIFGAGLFRYEL